MQTETTPPVGANDAPRPSPANDGAIGLIQAGFNIRLRSQRSVNMTLASAPSSPAAEAFVLKLYNDVGGASSSVRRRGLLAALGAISYDLLVAAQVGSDTPCFRRMSADSYTGRRIGRRAAKAAINLMESASYIRLAGGNFDRQSGEPFGTVTRIFPTPALLGVLAAYGITPANRRDHFAPAEVALVPYSKLILLNTAARWRGEKRVKGKPLAVDYSNPAVAEYAGQVARINAFAAAQVIEGVEHHGFHRIFNKGDQPDSNYNKGGRLWCVGGGYQVMPRRLKPGRKPEDLRSAIRINGEETVELDIGSSHLTIFLAKLGVPFDPQNDLYQVKGFDRNVIKAYINLTLSQPRIPTRWPKSMIEDFLEDNGYAIDRDHSINSVSEACLAAYPVLRSRPDIALDWADLQFIESQAIIDAVDSLNQHHGILALPVHDSLIVQRSHLAVAIEVLKDRFYSYVGVYPRIK